MWQLDADAVLLGWRDMCLGAAVCRLTRVGSKSEVRAMSSEGRGLRTAASDSITARDGDLPTWFKSAYVSSVFAGLAGERFQGEALSARSLPGAKATW